MLRRTTGSRSAAAPDRQNAEGASRSSPLPILSTPMCSLRNGAAVARRAVPVRAAGVATDKQRGHRVGEVQAERLEPEAAARVPVGPVVPAGRVVFVDAVATV